MCPLYNTSIMRSISLYAHLKVKVPTFFNSPNSPINQIRLFKVLITFLFHKLLAEIRGVLPSLYFCPVINHQYISSDQILQGHLCKIFLFCYQSPYINSKVRRYLGIFVRHFYFVINNRCYISSISGD